MDEEQEQAPPGSSAKERTPVQEYAGAACGLILVVVASYAMIFRIPVEDWFVQLLFFVIGAVLMGGATQWSPRGRK
jgi:hypothetical protein